MERGYRRIHAVMVFTCSMAIREQTTTRCCDWHIISCVADRCT